MPILFRNIPSAVASWAADNGKLIYSPAGNLVRPTLMRMRVKSLDIRFMNTLSPYPYDWVYVSFANAGLGGGGWAEWRYGTDRTVSVGLDTRNSSASEVTVAGALGQGWGAEVELYADVGWEPRNGTLLWTVEAYRVGGQGHLDHMVKLSGPNGEGLSWPQNLQAVFAGDSNVVFPPSFRIGTELEFTELGPVSAGYITSLVIENEVVD